MKKIIIVVFSALSILSCKDAEKKSAVVKLENTEPKKYEVIDNKETRTSRKNQLLEYAVYKSDDYSKEELKSVLIDMQIDAISNPFF